VSDPRIGGGGATPPCPRGSLTPDRRCRRGSGSPCRGGVRCHDRRVNRVQVRVMVRGGHVSKEADTPLIQASDARQADATPRQASRPAQWSPPWCWRWSPPRPASCPVHHPASPSAISRPEQRPSPTLVLGEKHFETKPGRAPAPGWLPIPQRGCTRRDDPRAGRHRQDVRVHVSSSSHSCAGGRPTPSARWAASCSR